MAAGRIGDINQSSLEVDIRNLDACDNGAERLIAGTGAPELSGDINEIVLVGGSTRIPVIQTLPSQLVDGKQINQNVNTDEVMMVGAALQASVLVGNVKDIELLDVSPLFLRVETLGGVATVLIPGRRLYR